MEDPFSKIIRMLVDKKGDKGIPLLDQVTSHKSHESYHTGFEMLETPPQKIRWREDYYYYY